VPAEKQSFSPEGANRPCKRANPHGYRTTCTESLLRALKAWAINRFLIWVIQRIGQGVFRAALMDYWDSRCPLTGITDPAPLRASHIIPWSDCGDEQRLDVHNGLLLSALWDAAFDQGLVSFADDGTPLIGPRLSEAARKTLGVDAALPLRGLRASHRANLAVHRSRHGFEN
jgi:hypothetical protein